MKNYKLIILFLIIILTGVCTGYYLSLDKPNDSANPPKAVDQNASNQSNIPENKPKPPEGAFVIRGIVEGFYGRPWTFAERREMLAFLEPNHFNTYVYAPKDDPFQRSKWWELYPLAELKELQNLCASGKTKGISLVYSISPGIPQPLPGQKLLQSMIDNSISFSSTADFAKLKAKIQQLSTAGINTFMLSFDDVEHYLRKEDQKQYGNNYAKAHIDLANKLYAEGKKISPDFNLWFAPTSYYGLKDNAYWKELRNNLNSEIQVIWTGSWVLAKNITGEQALKVSELLGRKPLIWDNYPVNDYTFETEKAPRLMLGPLENRSSDLSQYSTGIISNPMIQPEASKIALSTVGEYLWDPKNYDPRKTWLKSIEKVSGRDSAALIKFCSYSSSSVLNDNKNKSDFLRLTESFWKSYNSGTSIAQEAPLRSELVYLSSLPSKLDLNVENKKLLTEIDPWLKKLAREGETGLLALDYLKIDKLNPQKSNKRKELEQKIKELRSDKLNIGSEIIVFVEKCLTVSN